MPHFDGVSGRVYYRHWAAPDARAGLVFLHGYGEHSGLYHRFAAALNQRGIDLWALDEIGHGLTDGERGHVGSADDLEANARSLARLASAARPGLPLALAGHSLGGAAAALLLTRSPEPFSAAVLSGTPLQAPDWFSDQDASAGLDLAASDLSSDPFYLDELANDPLAFTDSEASPLGALAAVWERLEHALPAVAVPILFVHGELDPIADIAVTRRWAPRLPDARLHAVAGARHDVLNEVAHRQVATEIADFVLAATAG